MKTHLPLPSRRIACLSASLLFFVATPSWASCGSGTPTISPVPSLGGSLYRINALNANGQLAGYSYLPGDLEMHAFRLDSTGPVDLGTLGGSVSEAFALNRTGQTAGESILTGDSGTHAFLHDGVTMLDLSTLGGTYSTAAAINDAGQVAGYSQLSDNASLEAFLFQNGTLTGLGDLGGGFSTAAAINQSGQVAGSSLTPQSEFHAYLYSAGTMNDLGSLGGGYSVAYALNDAGTVVGDSALASGETHGFVYSGGTMTDVGTLGGTSSSAYAINQAGQAIGTAATPDDAEIHGFIYSGGQLTDLGTLGGSYSTPWAINDAGQVVGETETAEFAPRAFLWQNGTMLDLNTLVTGSGWELTGAYFINNAGRIVGQGTLNGTPQWFILDLGGNNRPPLANAGADQTTQCSGQVTLDGTQSSDPDGDALSYAWSEGDVQLGTNSTLSVSLGAGEHTITLKVSDPCGDSAKDTVVVHVASDTTPPTISCPGATEGKGAGNCETIVPDLRPLAVVSDNCTPANDLVITQDPAAGTVLGAGEYTITLTATDAAGNSASCTSTITGGDTRPPLICRAPNRLFIPTGHDCEARVPNLKSRIVARDNCTPTSALVITQSPAAGTMLPKGEHLITVTVTDASGNSTSKHVTLKIVDRTPPKIQSVTASPNLLLPADHRQVVVQVSVAASDNCDDAPVSKIVRVLCDERVGRGDIEIQGDLTVKLAASRNPRGNGRTYIIIVRCQDSSGNTAYRPVAVKVPRTSDGGKH